MYLFLQNHTFRIWMYWGFLDVFRIKVVSCWMFIVNWSLSYQLSSTWQKDVAGRVLQVLQAVARTIWKTLLHSLLNSNLIQIWELMKQVAAVGTATDRIKRWNYTSITYNHIHTRTQYYYLNSRIFREESMKQWLA